MEKISPATASPYRTKPGSRVISGCHGSVSAGRLCASPQIRDSAGLTKKPNSGGEKRPTSASLPHRVRVQLDDLQVGQRHQHADRGEDHAADTGRR